MNENRLLYVSLIDKSDPRLLGVIKKVESILRVFNKCDCEAAILCFNTKEEMELYNNEKVLKSFRITHTVSRKSLLSRYKRKKEIFDIIYNVATKVYRSDIVIFRYIMTDHFFVRILDEFNHFGICTILDIPTYPYDKELKKNLYWHAKSYVDRFYRRRLRKNVNFVYSPSDESYIFGIQNIRATNGIDCSSIKIQRPREGEFGDLHFVSVANVSFWHGYDRIIRGMCEYYKSNPSKPVYYYCVGEGDVLPELKKLVNELDLNSYVIFHGTKTGEDLDKVVDECDIAFGSLGNHRKGLYADSALKNREYCARGIPFVIASDDQDFPETFPFVYRIPKDDSPVDINQVIKWYENLIKEHPNYSIEMRKYAEENLSWDAKMKPVIEKIKELAKEKERKPTT